jgi:HK97 family phage major capsid protein
MTRAAWYASHTTRPELMKLSVPIGVAGTFVPLTIDANGQYRLLGIPLFWDEHLPALGDAGDLLLGDFSQYALGLRKEVTIDKSAHAGFTSDLMTYRGIVRADGFPMFDAAFQPKNGTTQSPFVKLAERA